MSLTPLMTVDQVADYIRAEHRTVRRAIHAGELEAAMIGGRWLMREDAVEAWFQARTRSGSPRPETRPAPRQITARAGASRLGSLDRLKAIEGSGG
jgi:excisionase family DNA binding protein